MKKYIFAAIAVVTSLFTTSCSDDDAYVLDSISVSSSYVAIPLEGGSTTITVNAKGDWQLEVDSVTKTWLNISNETGVAGETEVTFSAEPTVDGRSAEILLVSGAEAQHINVMQGVKGVTNATCAEVIAGIENKTYRVTATVTAIANTSYGNFYMNDGTGELYIYGTKDANGNYNWAKFGIEVGDEVTVEGSRKTYGSTIEFVDALWIKTNKSLIKVDSVYNEVLPLEGGVFETYLITKGQGVSVEIPEDAKSWLSIQSIDQKGTDACVKFRAAENTGGDRETTITFRTTDGKKNYTAQTTLTQKGAIVPVTIAEFNGKEVGNAVFRLTGIVTKVEDAAAGKYYISDYTGSTYVYKAANSGDVKVGDVVTLTGKHAEYKGNPQVGSGSLETIEASAEAISLADFNAAADDDNKFYLLKGKISEIANATYGNVYIEDETGAKVYLYGCYGDWTGTNKKNFLGDNGIVVGDVITVVTIKTSYKDAAQGKNAVCFGVEKAN